MVKIKHGVELVSILDKADFFGIRFKLLHIHVIDIVSYQRFNYFFEVEPPKEQPNKITNQLKPILMNRLLFKVLNYITNIHEFSLALTSDLLITLIYTLSLGI